MNDVNSVVLVGRIVRDVWRNSIRYLASGTAVLNFSIAVNESFKDGDRWTEKPSFFDVSFYGRQAEGLQQYLIKGKQIAVNGTLQQQRWQKDGQVKSKVVIVAKMIQLLGSAREGNLDDAVSTPPACEDDFETIPF